MATQITRPKRDGPYKVVYYAQGSLHFVAETFRNLRAATHHARHLVPDGMKTMEAKALTEYWIASEDRGQTWAAAAIPEDALDVDVVLKFWHSMTPRPVPARSRQGAHTA